jgi:hypothetical protein
MNVHVHVSGCMCVCMCVIAYMHVCSRVRARERGGVVVHTTARRPMFLRDLTTEVLHCMCNSAQRADMVVCQL